MCCSKELELTLSSCSSCSERTSSHFLIVLSEQQRGGQIIKLAIQREEESLGWMELRKQLIFDLVLLPSPRRRRVPIFPPEIRRLASKFSFP
ncbi:hypothetical protein CDAR_281631 [Caerostris darwini]|uniref:Uncharacterized protein n=1 Tax=Caerostris darwini TaxID=1538125 RepID=A0AAV4UHC4_9ARAC|nr:hypothetical protein CDAR_281631 [Caerostris darwini]